MQKKKDKKLALYSGIQTYQTFTNNDEVCIPRLSNILLGSCNYRNNKLPRPTNTQWVLILNQVAFEYRLHFSFQMRLQKGFDLIVQYLMKQRQILSLESLT